MRQRVAIRFLSPLKAPNLDFHIHSSSDSLLHHQLLPHPHLKHSTPHKPGPLHFFIQFFLDRFGWSLRTQLLMVRATPGLTDLVP
jgi:hypothetical protein